MTTTTYQLNGNANRAVVLAHPKTGDPKTYINRTLAERAASKARAAGIDVHATNYQGAAWYLAFRVN